MRHGGQVCLAVAVAMSLGLGSPPLAVAQEEEEREAPSLPDEREEPEQEPILESIQRALETQQAIIEELEARLEQQEDRDNELSIVRLFGYADIGFFVPRGNDGAGWVRDFSNAQFPEFAGRFGWVFLGDILATTVNTRGEVADLGDAPAAVRFDSIDSEGALGFLVNEIMVGMELQLADSVLVRTMFNVVPRTGNDFALGDFIEADLAEFEWVLTDDGKTSVWVGKTLPVFGIEYQERKSHQRFGITPSLIQRYTSGTQLGIKGRSKLFSDWLILAAAVTNGSSTTEQFHFYNEIDVNNGKTLNGRVAVNVPIGRLFTTLAGHRLEVGLSGMWGPQDRSTELDDAMWFVGVDLLYRTTDFALKAQWMRGGAPGLPEEGVWGIDLHDSGYVELNWMFLPYLGALVRGGLRDAFVTLGTERAYLTKSLRFTGGLRAVFNAHLVLKAEYLHNREFGGIEQFPNDIFTSSLVLAY